MVLIADATKCYTNYHRIEKWTVLFYHVNVSIYFSDQKILEISLSLTLCKPAYEYVELKTLWN